MTKLAAWIAAVGTNPYFIAANAHAGFAFMVMAWSGRPWVAAPIVVLAAVKEFAFDATQEIPKQTAFDNWTDWAGYVVGALLGVWFLMRR